MLGWIVIVVIALAAVYEIFIVSPPSVVATPPSGFETLTPITQINFDPTSVINSPTYQSLKSYIPEPTSTGPVSVGRTNPFVP